MITTLALPDDRGSRLPGLAWLLLGAALSALQLPLFLSGDHFSLVLAAASSPAFLLIPLVPFLFSSSPAYLLLAILLFPLAVVAATLGPLVYWVTIGRLLSRCSQAISRRLFFAAVSISCGGTLLVFLTFERADLSRAPDLRSISTVTTLSLVILGNILMWTVYRRRRWSSLPESPRVGHSGGDPC